MNITSTPRASPGPLPLTKSWPKSVARGPLSIRPHQL